MTSDDVRSTSMGASGQDILLSPLARSRFPFDVECKSKNAIAVYSWLEQRANEGHTAIVFAKGNHKEPVVILYAKDFLKLIKEIHDIGREVTETSRNKT